MRLVVPVLRFTVFSGFEEEEFSFSIPNVDNVAVKIEAIKASSGFLIIFI